MAQTSFPNTLIYECSSENATVNITSNEWVNEFSEGLELSPGDTIRILGSFINEKGQGDQIEITEDNNKFTMEYMPIHNLYQYTKLSDDYAAPNDTSRTDLNKLQFSNILNYDTPTLYDGKGSPILSCPGTARAKRWYDGCPINRYYNKSGFNNINPNEQYLDAELVKAITCVHADGICIRHFTDEGDLDNTQYFDFPGKGGEAPWGGDKSPYGSQSQLAFGSFYFVITNDGNDPPNFTLSPFGSGDNANIKPTGVTGKIMGVKYSTNKMPYTGDDSAATFLAGEMPLVTFLVGNHVVETKIDESTINPSDPYYNGFIGNINLGSIQLSADNLNQINGPRNKAGSTFSVGKNGTSVGFTMDRMMDGFTSGFTDYTEAQPAGTNKLDGSSLYYEFYNTGAQCLNNYQIAGVQAQTQSQSILKDGDKVYYVIDIIDTNTGVPDEIYYRFLKPYQPDDIMSQSQIGNRLYLPFTIAEPELQFTANAGDTITDETYLIGQYRDDAGGSTTTTGGYGVGCEGLAVNAPLKVTYGDNVQQPVRPGFQTNINMMSSTNLKTETNASIAIDPVASLGRKAGGYPALNYADQLDDMVDYKQDMYLIQTRKVNYEIPVGFYTPDRLANVLNDLLHLNNDNYKIQQGEGNITGEKLYDNWTYAPTNVNGPFVSTKIPECNGGYIPPDTNFEKASLSNGKRPPGLRLDNNEYGDDFITENLYNDGNSAAEVIAILNGTNPDGMIKTKMKDAYTDPKAFVFCPYPYAKYEDNQFEFSTVDKMVAPAPLFSGDVDGGAIDFSGDALIPNLWSEWLLTNFHPCPLFMGVGSYRTEGVLSTGTFAKKPDTAGEMGEGVLGRVQNLPFGNTSKAIMAAPWTYFDGHGMGVLNRNGGGFFSGALSRSFMGSNDLTFLYDEDEERFSFSNTYTPFRPAGFENSKDKDEFTVDDAVPSVLINTEYEGHNLYAITQIYIYSITADPVCKEKCNVDNRLSILGDIANPDKQKAGSIELWKSLGFTGLPEVVENDGTYTFTETRWCDDIFYQSAIGETQGANIPIYNIAETNPSLNAQNPAKSQCLITLPNREFLVQTISEEFKAPNPPTLTTYPFYLIGSSIPSNFYHGSKTGTELPVVGICSRNFSAGSFVFDLSQSSVEWTISENITLTSIKTKILKNDFSPATNLFGNSAIIYAITKNNYYNEVPEPDATKLEQMREKQIEKEALAYNNAPIPVQPPQTYIMPSLVYQELMDDSD